MHPRHPFDTDEAECRLQINSSDDEASDEKENVSKPPALRSSSKEPTVFKDTVFEQARQLGLKDAKKSVQLQWYRGVSGRVDGLRVPLSGVELTRQEKRTPKKKSQQLRLPFLSRRLKPRPPFKRGGTIGGVARWLTQPVPPRPPSPALSCRYHQKDLWKLKMKL